MSNEVEQLLSTNATYKDLRETWQYHFESYMGGEVYKKAGHLTRYANEDDKQYAARFNATYLDNHCESVVSVYNSFLFREPPIRDLGQLKDLEETKNFLKDADLDGRNLNSFMKDVSTWSSVFGHCWIIVAKPDVNAGTRAEELAQDVRPYVSLLTPLTVLDWSWKRLPNSLYVLDYLKYIEGTSGDLQYIKEWTPEIIRTTTVNVEEEDIVATEVEDNQLGSIPAVIAYANKSIVRGVGTSDINDIADAQRFIYNNNSEIEQSIRIDSHPSLVKTKETKANAGAGSIVDVPEDLDPGLKPYMLQSSGADIQSILKVSEATVYSIDKMANTGSVRASETRTLSGVAMQTEFQLLNARLSEKADNLELAEEQMWRIFADYQDKAWDGEVKYADSFNIQDVSNEVLLLEKAKSITTDTGIINAIDKQLVELLGEDPSKIITGNNTQEGEPPASNTP